MGGKTTNNTTTNQTASNAPPEWALPGLQELASRITSIIPNVPGPQYGGEFVAGPNATQLSSLPLYAAASQTGTNAAAQVGAGANALTAGGPQFDPMSVPLFDTSAAAQAATAPLLRNLTEQVLPSLRSSALSSGAYGNSRMNTILPSLAIRDTMRNAQEIGAGMEQSAFNTQQGNQLGAFNLATQRGLGTEGLRQQALTALPSMLDAQMRYAAGAADAQAQAGTLQQGWDQAAIDNQLAKFNYNLQYPFQGLDTASQLLAGLAHGYGTQTSSGTSNSVQQSGGLAPVLGGIMGLGSLAASFLPGVGPIAGGILGRLGSAVGNNPGGR